jgi:hypothetical protein
MNTTKSSVLEIGDLRHDYARRTVLAVPARDMARYGAGHASLAALTLAERVTLLIAGVILGFALGHGATHALERWLAGAGSWPLAVPIWVAGEVALAATVPAAGSLTCVVPAILVLLCDPASLPAKR